MTGRPEAVEGEVAVQGDAADGEVEVARGEPQVGALGEREGAGGGRGAVRAREGDGLVHRDAEGVHLQAEVAAEPDRQVHQGDRAGEFSRVPGRQDEDDAAAVAEPQPHVVAVVAGRAGVPEEQADVAEAEPYHPGAGGGAGLLEQHDAGEALPEEGDPGRVRGETDLHAQGAGRDGEGGRHAADAEFCVHRGGGRVHLQHHGRGEAEVLRQGLVQRQRGHQRAGQAGPGDEQGAGGGDRREGGRAVAQGEAGVGDHEADRPGGGVLREADVADQPLPADLEDDPGARDGDAGGQVGATDGDRAGEAVERDAEAAAEGDARDVDRHGRAHGAGDAAGQPGPGADHGERAGAAGDDHDVAAGGGEPEREVAEPDREVKGRGGRQRAVGGQHGPAVEGEVGAERLPADRQGEPGDGDAQVVAGGQLQALLGAADHERLVHGQGTGDAAGRGAHPVELECDRGAERAEPGAEADGRGRADRPGQAGGGDEQQGAAAAHPHADVVAGVVGRAAVVAEEELQAAGSELEAADVVGGAEPAVGAGGGELLEREHPAQALAGDRDADRRVRGAELESQEAAGGQVEPVAPDGGGGRVDLQRDAEGADLEPRVGQPDEGEGAADGRGQPGAGEQQRARPVGEPDAAGLAEGEGDAGGGDGGDPGTGRPGLADPEGAGNGLATDGEAEVLAADPEAVRGGVDSEADRPGEGDAGQGERDRDLQLPSQPGRRGGEAAGAPAEQHEVGAAVAEPQRHVAEGERGGAGGLLDREVAAQGLPEDGERDAGAGQPQVRPGPHVEAGGGLPQRHGFDDPCAGGVHHQGEAAPHPDHGGQQAGEVDRAGERARDAGGGDHEHAVDAGEHRCGEVGEPEVGAADRDHGAAAAEAGGGAAEQERAAEHRPAERQPEPGAGEPDGAGGGVHHEPEFVGGEREVVADAERQAVDGEVPDQSGRGEREAPEQVHVTDRGAEGGGHVEADPRRPSGGLGNLLDADVPDEAEPADADGEAAGLQPQRGRTRGGSRVELQGQPGRQPESRDGEADRARDVAGQPAGVQSEGAGAVAEPDDVGGAVAEAGLQVRDGDDERGAGAVGGAGEGDVAGDPLAGDGELDAGALHAQVRAGGQVELLHAAVEAEALADADSGGVERHAQGAAEAHGVAGHDEGDGAADPSGHAGAGEREERGAVGDADAGGGGAEGEADVGGDQLDADGRLRRGRGARHDRAGDLGEDEHARHSLAGHGEFGRCGRRADLDPDRARRERDPARGQRRGGGVELEADRAVEVDRVVGVEGEGALDGQRGAGRAEHELSCRGGDRREAAPEAEGERGAAGAGAGAEGDDQARGGLGEPDAAGQRLPADDHREIAHHRGGAAGDGHIRRGEVGVGRVGGRRVQRDGSGAGVVEHLDRAGQGDAAEPDEFDGAAQGERVGAAGGDRLPAGAGDVEALGQGVAGGAVGREAGALAEEDRDAADRDRGGAIAEAAGDLDEGADLQRSRDGHLQERGGRAGGRHLRVGEVDRERRPAHDDLGVDGLGAGVEADADLGAGAEAAGGELHRAREGARDAAGRGTRRGDDREGADAVGDGQAVVAAAAEREADSGERDDGGGAAVADQEAAAEAGTAGHGEDRVVERDLDVGPGRQRQPEAGTADGGGGRVELQRGGAGEGDAGDREDAVQAAAETGGDPGAGDEQGARPGVRGPDRHDVAQREGDPGGVDADLAGGAVGGHRQGGGPEAERVGGEAGVGDREREARRDPVHCRGAAVEDGGDRPDDRQAAGRDSQGRDGEAAVAALGGGGELAGDPGGLHQRAGAEREAPVAEVKGEAAGRPGGHHVGAQVDGTGDLERQPGARQPQRHIGGDAEGRRGAGDGERLRDGGVAGVELQAQRPGEAEPGDGEGDRAADLARDGAAGEDEERRAVAEPGEAAGEGNLDAGEGEPHERGAGGAGALLQHQVAAELLPGDGEHDPAALDPQVGAGGQSECRRAGRVDGQRDPAADAERAAADAQGGVEPSGEAGAAELEPALDVGGFDDPAAEVEAAVGDGEPYHGRAVGEGCLLQDEVTG